MFLNNYTIKKFLSLQIFFFLGLVAWILYGWNTWNGDREAYERIFYSGENILSGFEFLYTFSNVLAKNYGLSFQEYQIIIALITVILYIKFCYSFSEAPIAAFIAYLVFFFPLDYVLIRNTLSTGLVLCGLLFLIKGKPYAKLWYLFFILAATSIHQSSFVFLLFLLIHNNSKIRMNAFIPMFLFMMFLNYLIISTLSKTFPLIYNHLNFYESTFNASMINTLVHLTIVAYVNCVILKEKFSMLDRIKNININKYYFLYNLNVLSSIFIILYFTSDITTRYLKLFILINVVFLIGELKTRKFFTMNVSAVIVILSFVFYFYIIPFKELSLVPLFNENSILEIF